MREMRIQLMHYPLISIEIYLKVMFTSCPPVPGQGYVKLVRWCRIDLNDESMWWKQDKGVLPFIKALSTQHWNKDYWAIASTDGSEI